MSKYTRSYYPIVADDQINPYDLNMYMQVQDSGINLIAQIAATMVLTQEEPGMILEELMDIPYPLRSESTELERVTWWMRAEAKYRILKAKALIDELEAQSLLP